jgi:lipid II:glycine glycyltransferase (peptidoglycan interpeptide bridge formation enzyme)
MSKRNIEQRFLQSPEWERFLYICGKETFRVGENLFVVEELPVVGKYAYCPRGPKKSEQFVVSSEQWGEIIKKAKKYQCGWIRIEPSTQEELQKIQELSTHSSLFIPHSPKDIQPREILVMDISRSEDELFAAMKPKTRYNIRLAEKRGVEIVVSREKGYREKFLELVCETAERAGIRSHPREHYEKMFEVFDEEMLSLYIAKYNGESIAANMVVFQEDFAIYLHGGSSNTHRNVMASFLLQWRAIQDAKKRGCVWYDFGGVDTMKKEKKDWRGITKFKQGFAPNTKSVRFPGTYDVTFRPWTYRMYKIVRSLR